MDKTATSSLTLEYVPTSYTDSMDTGSTDAIPTSYTDSMDAENVILTEEQHIIDLALNMLFFSDVSTLVSTSVTYDPLIRY